MVDEYLLKLDKLRGNGWKVVLGYRSEAITRTVQTRYHWLPVDVKSFIEETKDVTSPDQTSWFVSGLFSSDLPCAFRWNEWETMSLHAADNDPELIARIRTFWDDHFPFMMSVKDGYAYFALRRSDYSIVQGEEPEFEEAHRLADSFLEFLGMVASQDQRLSRWI